MSQYIITIVPVVEDGLPASAAQTVVRVETTGGALVVREITVRAFEDAELTGNDLLQVDYELLLRALGPGRGQPAARDGAAVAGVRRTVSPVPGPLTAAARQRPASRSFVGAGRAYRRAPEPDDLERAYLDTGSIAGVAQHFGVPVHTAQGWVSRLRRQKLAQSTE